MIQALVVGTDVLIDHLRGDASAHNLLLSVERGDYLAHYSTITEAELYAGKKKMRRRAEARRVEELLNLMQRVEVTGEIARRGGTLRRSFCTDLPDVIVAVTALLSRGRLVSRNLKHYVGITGLNIVSPVQLMGQTQSK